MRNHFGVVTNNMGAMVNLLVGFFAVGGDDLLGLLNVCGVNNCLADVLGDLAGVFLWVLAALLVLLVVALGCGGVSNFSMLGFMLVVSTVVTPIVDINNLGVISDHM